MFKKLWQQNSTNLKQQLGLSDSINKNLKTQILQTPPVEAPDSPNDTPGASKQLVLTPHDIPSILRKNRFCNVQSENQFEISGFSTVYLEAAGK